MRAPITVWVLTISNSSGVSLPIFIRMVSGTPILPTSCSSAARRMSDTWRVGQPELLGQERRHLPDAVGVLAGVVVAELGGDRQPLDDLDLRLDQLARPLAHLGLEQLVLALDLDVEEARLEQRLDAQQQLVLLERLVDEVLGAARQRLAPRFRRQVARQDQDRQVRRLGDLVQLVHHLEPVHVRHVQVEQDEIGPVLDVERADLARVVGASRCA